MKIKYLASLFLLFFALVACDKEDPIINTPATRTVLLYLAGDNSLSSYSLQNIEMIKKGLLKDGVDNGNLLIYLDNRSEAPHLFQLKLEADTIRQIEIEEYDKNQNSASTKTLTQVIDKTISEFPSDNYGLILWSHGSGWLPSDIHGYLRSFGQDGSDNFMEINDLSSALSNYHFDFILFDACYMACAEVAYSFRGCADYIISSPTEILANGFPYQDIMGDMFKEEADVVDIATRFYEHYKNDTYPYGTISVVKSAALDELAAISREIFKDKTETDLFAIPVNNLQIMEYLTPHYHALYDFDDYVGQLATTAQYAKFKQNLDKAVIYKATTPKSFYSYPYPSGTPLPINKFSGLSIYVPQEALPKLNEWYKDLEWYKDVYQ
ncbi:MAG: clostripain-related cysteine peptidase [Parabacteroides sp.]|nr:clostripain-related cysteine peptidase [Parabacteroides sp.]